MKLKLLFTALAILCFGQMFAQTYPEVSIRAIQYISPDSLLTSPYDYVSQYEGDTVIVSGVVVVAPRYGASPDSNEILRVGAPGLLLRDPNDPEYSGLLVRYLGSDASDFNLLDTGMVIKVKGYVKEYFTTTQFNAIEFTSEGMLGFEDRPKPIVLTLDSLAVLGTYNPQYLAEKWEQMYVEVHNVFTSDPNAINSGSFRIFDENGTSVIVGSSSSWRYTSAAPLAGTKLEYVRGYLESRNNISAGGWFIINPCYYDDIKYGDIIPPRITNLTRDKAVVTSSDQVTVTAKIKDPDGTITSAKVYYRLENETTFQSIDMNATVGDSIYSGIIPAQTNGSVVAYYVEAKDNDNATSTNPSNLVTGLFFYKVTDSPLTIKDVQYSPFGSGYSGYNGYVVTVSGTVTADTTDLEGDGSSAGPQVYIQDGTGPWSGVKLFGTQVLTLRRGDNVTVTGTVYENYNVTEIKGLDDASKVVVNSTGNAVPEATEISTQTIGTVTGGTLPAESYEGVLVKYSTLTVTDDNADGDSGPVSNNYGEIYVSDASNIQTRIEVQEGTHTYNNFWDASQENSDHRIHTGDTFTSITGIMYFSYSNYKVIPRKDTDFDGFVGVEDEVATVPETYSVAQNYPNPFNPSTTIEFAIPKAGFVSVKVYNSLGQQVNTLVNSYMNSGNHKVMFNAANLSSGVYFYRVEADNFNTVKKMVLMK